MPYDANGNLIDEYGNPLNPLEAQPNYENYGVDLGGGGLGSEGQGLRPDPVSPPRGVATEAPIPAGPSTLDQMLGHANASKDEGLALIQNWENKYIPKLEGAQAQADASTQANLGDLDKVYADAGPVDYYDKQPDLVSQAALAQADPQARAAQYDALSKLKGWTDPKVTAVEKFLQKQAQMNEERDQRAHREASLRDMSARGVRSGGAEMAALLGGQQVTSRNRLLSDLGTQAGAVQRALGATETYGQQAGNLAGQTFAEGFARGGATDSTAKFNQEQTAQYQLNKVAHKVSERDKGVERGERKYGAHDKATADTFGRQETITNATFKPAVAKVDAAAAGNQGISDWLRTKLGLEETEKAINLMKDKEDGDIPWYQMPFDPGGHTGNWGSSDSGSAGQRKLKNTFGF